MRKKGFLLCVFLLMLSSHLTAQNEVVIGFRVLDAGTNKEIPYATIFIEPCSCGGVTNEDGYFEKSLTPDTYRITTTYLGYLSDTTVIDVAKKANYNIELKEEGYLLNSVTVTGTNTRDNIEKTVMGVQQLSIEKIKTLPTAIGEIDILKSLTMLSGVGSAGEASNGLSIRGGSLDQNLVLLDNAPVYNTTHLFGLFSIFTPDAIRGVDLYQGNMPAKYGGRISSVVDVKVENPSLDDFEFKGGIGLVSSRLAVNTPLKKNKLGLLLGVRASYNDFLIQRVQRLKNTKANFIDGTMKLRYQINERNSVYYTAFYSQDFYQLDINSNINNISADANQYDYSTLNNTVSWVSNIGSKSYLTTSFVNSNYQPKIIFPQSSIDNTITFASSIQNIGLQTEYYNPISEQISLTAGVQVNRTALNPGELSSAKPADIQEQKLAGEVGVEGAAYASLDWKLSSNISLALGLRYAHFFLLGPYDQAIYEDDNRRNQIGIESNESGTVVKDYGLPEPRLGLRWKLSENTSVKASYALTRQYIQNIYNSTTPLPTSRWKMPDSYILPQTGQTYSVGFYQNLYDNVITVGLESYFRSIENVLDYKPGADFFLQRFIEQDVLQGKGRNYGVELSLEKPQGKINGWCNYTYSRSLRQFEADILSDRINNNEWFPSDFDRPHVFNGTVNYEANEFNTVSVNFTYQTGRPYTIPNATIVTENIVVPVFLERNNSRLPDYHRLDFSWRIHNITTKETRWKGDWIFTIYNLYNRDNAFNIFFAGQTQSRPGASTGSGPLGAYKLSIFSSTMVSVGYNFRFQ